MRIDLGKRMARIGRPVAGGAGLLVSLLAGAAQAQEYCVACSDPPGLYRCVIEGAQPRGGQSLQMLCVTAMAKEGGHATCSVKRATVFECDAAVKRIPWAALEPGLPPDTPEVPGAPQPPRPARVATPPPGGPEAPPQTMVDLAKQANEKTAEQMKKAGDSVKQAGESVKEATKKTWDCVFSFFTRC
jgi:hypothetical protein